MELTDIRKEIDKIDSELKELYFKRMELSKEVAKIKAAKENGTQDSVYKPDREKQIIDRLTSDLDGDKEILKEDYILFIQRILENSKNYQRKLLAGGLSED